MPIIKSAKTRAKQNEKRRLRLRPFKTKMLTLIKNISKLVKEQNFEKAQETIKDVYKVIDTAAKKNIIHKNNASRKKSRVQTLINKELKNSKNKPKKDEKKIEEKPKKEASTKVSKEETKDNSSKTEKKNEEEKVKTSEKNEEEKEEKK